MRRAERLETGRFVFSKSPTLAACMSRTWHQSQGSNLVAYSFTLIPGKLVLYPYSSFVKITSVPSTPCDLYVQEGVITSIGSLTVTSYVLENDCAVCDFTSTAAIHGYQNVYLTMSGISLALGVLGTALGVTTSQPTTGLAFAQTTGLYGIADVTGYANTVHGYNRESASWMVAHTNPATIYVKTEQPLLGTPTVSLISGLGGTLSVQSVSGRLVTIQRVGTGTSAAGIIQLDGTTIYGQAYSRRFSVRVGETGNVTRTTAPTICVLPVTQDVAYVRGIAHSQAAVYINFAGRIEGASITVRVTNQDGVSTSSLNTTALGIDPFVQTVAVPSINGGKVEVKVEGVTARAGGPSAIPISLGNWYESVPVQSAPRRSVLDLDADSLPDVFATNAAIITPSAFGHTMVPRFVDALVGSGKNATTMFSSSIDAALSWTETFVTYYGGKYNQSSVLKSIKSDLSVVTTTVPGYTNVSAAGSIGSISLPASSAFYVTTFAGTTSGATFTYVTPAPGLTSNTMPSWLKYYPDEV